MTSCITILAFSDWRVQDIDELIEQVKTLDENLDIIVYAGDDVRRFLSQGQNKFEELANYSKYGVFAVIGNDCSQNDKSILKGNKVFDLHEQSQIIDNFLFIGQEGATKDIFPPLGATLYGEDEIHTHLSQMIKGHKNKKIVLISHSPPHSILDTAIRFHRSGGTSIGSTAIHQFIKKNRVILTICGHCHLMGGRYKKLGRKTILNIASHDHNGAAGRLAIVKISHKWKEAIVSFSPQIKDLYSVYGLYSIYGIGSKYYKKLQEAGIKTVKQLSLLSSEEISKRTGISKSVVSRWPLQARVSLNKENLLLEQIDLKNPVFVDIETNLTGTFVFMICIVDVQQNICKQFIAYEENDIEEIKIINKFLSFASTYKKLYCYSGSDFETRILRKRLEYYKIPRENLPLIKDLCYKLRKNLLTHLNTYELKSLGSLFGFNWRHNIDGIEIPELYHEFLSSKDKKILRIIQEKNQDDVMALRHILNEIKKMQIGKPCSLPLS